MNPSSSHLGSIEKETRHLMTSEGLPPPNLPCGDLLEYRDDYQKICVPLFNASISGDWKAAQDIVSKHQHLDLFGFGINGNYDTSLHIAVSAKRTRSMENFVRSLVNKMTNTQLALQNKDHNTALCIAAAAGNVGFIRIMLEKNPALLHIPGSQGMMPLYMASLGGRRETVRYLYRVSRCMKEDIWTDQNRNLVLQACVQADIFDIALEIVKDHPKLPVETRVLELLARKTYAFHEIQPSFFQRLVCGIIGAKLKPTQKLSDAAQLLQIIWKKILQLPKATIDDILRGPANPMSKHSSRIQFVAAEMGNVKFLVELIREYPDLIWKIDDENNTIFHVAVSHRHEGIYNLLYEIGSMKDIITPLKDEEGNNMLHLAAKNPKGGLNQELSAVQQMQRELLWFKEVYEMIPPSYRDRKNKDGLIPYELFMKEHKELFSLSENLIKETANQCIVAAALIITISFAAAFTVPGGYDQNNGIPIFIHNRYFIVFAISDAISLTLSTISILKFLSIFVSGCARRDFLLSLYSKLMTGLAILFLSISALLVGFAFSFFVLYQHKLIWVPILITALISIPVILFNRFPYDLLLDAYRTTYSTRYLFRPKQPLLYYKNPSF